MPNIRYLKNIQSLHPRYHPKTIGDLPKNTLKTSFSVLMTLYENETESEK